MGTIKMVTVSNNMNLIEAITKKHLVVGFCCDGDESLGLTAAESY